MIASSVMPVLARSLVEAMVGALKVIPLTPLLATPTIHLFTASSGSITPTSTIAQFTEATFSGYAAATLTLGGNLNFPNNLGLGMGGVVTFAANALITPPGEVCLGYWVDNGSSIYYAAELFQTPLSFVNAFDFLDLGLLFGLAYATKEN